MISDLGTSVESTNRILGDNVIHNWVCLDCGHKMATNVHWGNNRGRMPQRCPNCGVNANSRTNERGG